MKKIILVLGMVLVLASCSQKTSDTQAESPSTMNSAKSESVIDSKIDFSNPANVGGSGFGNFFISMIRTQNYDMALKFTSTESKEKFGVSTILEKYKSFDFNYKLGRASIASDSTSDGVKYTLTYITNEYATGKIKKMVLCIENDSCKLVLPDNLSHFLK